MNILLVHQIFALPEDGGGTRHYELAKYLVRKGHGVTVIASDVSYLAGIAKKNRSDMRDGIRIIYAKTYKSVHKGFLHRAFSFLSFALSSFICAVRLEGIDIIWGTSPPLFQAFTTYVISMMKGKPFILEVRDLWVDFARELGIIRSPAILMVLRHLEKYLYRSAHRIVVNSPGFIPYIEAYVEREKICLVPNGVTTSDFDVPSVSRSFRREFNMEDKFIAIYLGNIGVANDIESIIGAADNLRAHDAIRIVLMGGGIRKEAIRHDVEMKKLSNVLLLDTRPKSKMPEILADVDVCIATLKNISMFRTTYPNKVFDYMAAQKPTVLAIDGVIRAVIESSQGGVFVAPGDSRALSDAILRYYQDSEMKKRHGENAREYVRENFERESIASNLETLLLQCFPGG